MGFDVEGRRGQRTPQMLYREPSFGARKGPNNTKLLGLPMLPYWVRRQGWVGAVVGAFLFGIIICLVFTMGTVVKPEQAILPPSVPVRRTVTDQDIALSERLKKLEEERVRVAEAAKYDKAEADRLRNIIERDHDKDSPQQVALQQRIDRLEQVIRSQERRDASIKKVVPQTPTPTTPIVPQFESGVTVIAKNDVTVGNSDQVIVKQGSLGIVFKSNSDTKTKVQFMGAYGTKNTVVIFVKNEDLQRATLKDLQEDREKKLEVSQQTASTAATTSTQSQNVTLLPLPINSTKSDETSRPEQRQPPVESGSLLQKENMTESTLPPLPNKTADDEKGKWKELPPTVNVSTSSAIHNIAAKEITDALNEKRDWAESSSSDGSLHPPPRKVREKASEAQSDSDMNTDTKQVSHHGDSMNG